MSKKPETVFRERTEKDLRRLPNSWFESIQQKTIKATPDKIGCINGLFVAIEYKKDAATKAEVLQEYKHNLIRNIAKGRVYLAQPENWHNILEDLKILAR